MKYLNPLASFLLFCLTVAAIPAISGCAADPHGDVKACCAHGQCTVCKVNGDLACIDVEISNSTPKVEYQGKTYYFCSNDCKKEFEKNPAKFAGK